MRRMSTREQGSVEPVEAAPRPIDPGVRIGHVHLRTADIDRVKAFYCGVLGFDVVAEARDVPGWGTTGDILFVSAGGYHHHLGFNTWKSAGGGPQPDGVAGLHHVALNYPTRAGLADAVRRLQEAGVPLRQLSDHGTHEAVYLSDPDGNDLELAWDRPVEQWPVDERRATCSRSSATSTSTTCSRSADEAHRVPPGVRGQPAVARDARRVEPPEQLGQPGLGQHHGPLAQPDRAGRAPAGRPPRARR